MFNKHAQETVFFYVYSRDIPEKQQKRMHITGAMWSWN